MCSTLKIAAYITNALLRTPGNIICRPTYLAESSLRRQACYSSFLAAAAELHCNDRIYVVVKPCLRVQRSHSSTQLGLFRVGEWRTDNQSFVSYCCVVVGRVAGDNFSLLLNFWVFRKLSDVLCQKIFAYQWKIADWKNLFYGNLRAKLAFWGPIISAVKNLQLLVGIMLEICCVYRKIATSRRRCHLSQ